jgi:hypothetical protein
MGGLMTLAEAVVGESVNMPSKWYFGAGTFLLLLWIVTRINIDR